MKTIHHLRYHKLRDVPGIFGLAINAIYALGVIFFTLLSIIVGSFVVACGYIATPIREFFGHRN